MEFLKSFLVLTCLIVITVSACEFGPFVKSNGETVCYTRLADQLYWSDAKAQCLALNGRLPEIWSEEDNNILFGLMPTLSGPWDGIWLGLNDKTTEGAFVWDSTEQVPAYTNWLSGEPNDLNSAEDCATLLTTGFWYDLICDGLDPNYYFLVSFCEIAQDQTTTAAAIDCSQLANDKCDEATLTFVDRIPDIETMDDCQFFCDVIMADQCAFNILDIPQKQCLLIGSDFEAYEKTCKRLHGVPMSDEDLAYCLASQNPCDNFVKEECTITGNFQQELGANTVELCNKACIRTGCTYFSFDNEDPANPSCNMYTETTSPSCDLIRGPKSPPFSTC